MSSKKVPLAQSFVIEDEDEDEPQVDIMEGGAEEPLLQLTDLLSFRESKKCTDNFGLKPHQLRLVEALNNQKGSIAIHGVGSGKTRAAIAAAKCFLAANPKGQIVVVTPNTTIQNNFQLQMSKLNQGPTPVSFDKNKFHYITFKAITLPDTNDYKNIKTIITSNIPFLLIVDEAHNARTPDTSTFYNLHLIAMRATKVLLLTATPVVNNPSDIIPLLALINPTVFNKFFENDYENSKYKVKREYSKWFKVDASSNELTYLADIKKALNGFPKCIVSFYRVGPDDLLSFPKTKISEIYFVLDKNQQVEYEEHEKTMLKGATKLTNGFYNRTRQLSNTIKLGSSDNQKLAYIKDLLLDAKFKPKKFVVYSYFRAEGSLISDLLRWLPTANIPFAEITGDATAAVRNKAVADYNSDKIKVLVITKAGSEGIDLKNTTDIVITEPLWNESSNIQVIGRGVRDGSHTGAPFELHSQRPTVQVHKLFLIKPSDKDFVFSEKDKVPNPARGKDGKEHKISADLHLKLTSDKKQKLINEFLDQLSEDSIEVQNCSGKKEFDEELTIHPRRTIPTSKFFADKPLVVLDESNFHKADVSPKLPSKATKTSRKRPDDGDATSKAKKPKSMFDNFNVSPPSKPKSSSMFDNFNVSPPSKPKSSSMFDNLNIPSIFANRSGNVYSSQPQAESVPFSFAKRSGGDYNSQAQPQPQAYTPLSLYTDKTKGALLEKLFYTWNNVLGDVDDNTIKVDILNSEYSTLLEALLNSKSSGYYLKNKDSVFDSLDNSSEDLRSRINTFESIDLEYSFMIAQAAEREQQAKRNRQAAREQQAREQPRQPQAQPQAGILNFYTDAVKGALLEQLYQRFIEMTEDNYSINDICLYLTNNFTNVRKVQLLLHADKLDTTLRNIPNNEDRKRIFKLLWEQLDAEKCFKTKGEVWKARDAVNKQSR